LVSGKNTFVCENGVRHSTVHKTAKTDIEKVLPVFGIISQLTNSINNQHLKLHEHSTIHNHYPVT
jgi:hypothetical protein